MKPEICSILINFMFYFNEYQKYFLIMQKSKIQNFKLRVGKFWGNFFIVKKCAGWAYQFAGNLNFC